VNVNAPAYVYYARIIFERIVICMCFVVDLQVAAAIRAAVPLISCVLMEATQTGNLSLSLSLSLSLYLSLFVGSAHSEETMHWCRIRVQNFGWNLTPCVSESGMSDIWSTMCPYDGWACSTEVHTSR
jgi:hypothetical protein